MSNYRVEQRPTPQEFCRENNLPVELAGRIFLRPHHLRSLSLTLTSYLDIYGNFREELARTRLTTMRMDHIRLFANFILPDTPLIETLAEIEFAGLLENSPGDTISPHDYNRIKNFEPQREDIVGMVDAEIRIVKSILSLAPDAPIIVAGVLDEICRLKKEKGFIHCNVGSDDGTTDTYVLSALYVLSLRPGSSINMIQERSGTPIAFAIPSKLLRSRSFHEDIQEQLTAISATPDVGIIDRLSAKLAHLIRTVRHSIQV